MFTGIIEAIGVIKTKSGSRLVISRPSQFNDLKLGSSVSVSGVCLSVVTLSKKEMAFDVVPETFAKTKLGQMKVGDSVNLERALEKGGRFDGHMVQGHCEGVGEVVSVEVSSSGGNYSSLREVGLFPLSPGPFLRRRKGSASGKGRRRIIFFCFRVRCGTHRRKRKLVYGNICGMICREFVFVGNILLAVIF